MFVVNNNGKVKYSGVDQRRLNVSALVSEISRDANLDYRFGVAEENKIYDFSANGRETGLEVRGFFDLPETPKGIVMVSVDSLRRRHPFAKDVFFYAKLLHPRKGLVVGIKTNFYGILMSQRGDGSREKDYISSETGGEVYERILKHICRSLPNEMHLKPVLDLMVDAHLESKKKLK